MKPTLNTGFAIALAWPETFCKQPSSWYDSLASVFGINKNNYYRAGHAALVLVRREDNSCHYFDFGRYHAPFNTGRVRSAETDIELTMYTPTIIKKNSIINLQEILTELQNNEACHGDGTLHAAYYPIDFEAAFLKANELQNNSPIPYGPFLKGGSNCSRFVNACLRAGITNKQILRKLKFVKPLTPTPLNNINALGSKIEITQLRKFTPFYPHEKHTKEFILSTLPQPKKHENIPTEAQWLSGEGGGSWFEIISNTNHYKVNRFSPQGIFEFTQTYNNKGIHSEQFTVTYPSNYKVLSLKINEEVYSFEADGTINN